MTNDHLNRSGHEEREAFRPFRLSAGRWAIVGLFCLCALTVALQSVAVGATPAQTPAQLSAPDFPRCILILYAYGHGGKGVGIFDEGFLSVVGDAGVSVNDLYCEYLDLQRNEADPEYAARLRDQILHKYADKKIDLIITVQQPALHFLLQQGQALAPEAPVITVQAPLPTAAEAGSRRFLCLVAQFDIKGTLARALELFPATKRVVFVSGSSPADKAMRASAADIAAPLRGRLEFEYTTELPLDKMLERVASLPPQTIIIFTQYNRDTAGRVSLAYEVERMITKVANAPVFGLYDFNLRNNGIGGSVVSVQTLGETTARLALDVLHGKLQPTRAVTPVVSEVVPMFDWRQIERWGGDATRLPPESRFINRPPTLWVQYEKYVVVVALVLVVQSFTIGALLFQRRRRQRAEAALRLTRFSIEHAADALFWITPDARIVDVNEAACRSLGYTREELLRLRVPDVDAHYNAALWPQHFAELRQKGSMAFESEQIAKGGRRFPVEIVANFVRHHGEERNCAFVRDITVRKEVKEKLRLSEENLAITLQSIGDAVIATDTAGRITRMNRTAETLTGWPLAEALGRALPDVFRIVNALTRAPVINPVQLVMERGEIVGLANHTALLARDGREYQISDSAAPIRGADGMIAGVVLVFGDVTGQYRTQQALATTTELLERTGEIAKVGGWELDLRTRRLFWSLETCRIHEVDPPVAPALDQAINFYAPEARPTIQAALQAASERGTPYDLELPLITAKGRHVWVRAQCSPVVEDGRVTKLLGAFHDITARKQAEEKLRKQSELLDSASDAIYVRSLEHTVTYWNKGAERLYGWSSAEVIGRKLTELGLVEPAGFATAHAALLAQGDWSGEVRKTGKGGTERVVFCRWTLLCDGLGRPREVLAINTDITDKKQLESQYLRAQRMEGIGMLAGGIAHDLNNILTPIMISTSLLRDAIHDDESRQLLDSVQASTQRGAAIIRQLLTFARGQPGVRAPVPVRQLLREMEKLIRETFPRNLRLTVSVPLELWPVVGDATQIHQALMNLCVNARDAMPNGGALTLAADSVALDAAAAALMPAAKPGPHVCLRVSDTGAGIPPEQLEHIFDPFFTTKEIGQGTGLGLPTVLGIVRGHGGSVRVDSRVGRGTTFELYLPASPEAKVAETPESESRLPRGHGEMVLVVDDEAAVRGPARAVLEKYGYRVLVAAEGAAALRLFARHRPEIKAVLTDMMMPGMDGPKLVRELRQLDARLPILGMTGLIEQGKFKGLEELDAVPMLAKPFEMEKLLVALSQTLAAGNPPTGLAN